MKKGVLKGVLTLIGISLVLSLLFAGMQSCASSVPSDTEEVEEVESVVGNEEGLSEKKDNKETDKKNAETKDEEKEDVDKKDDEEERVSTWRDAFSKELVGEIEGAFAEIGENADNIESIEYISVRETDLFDRRDYLVTFYDERTILSVFDGEKVGWVHNKWYTITTEEWHEGEPEREQYPREFLVTIKDGDTTQNPTNINQWTWTGNGVKQTG